MLNQYQLLIINYTYSSASNLATFKIDNFFKLSIKNLNEYQYKTISKDQLNIDYWFKKIRKIDSKQFKKNYALMNLIKNKKMLFQSIKRI